MRHRLTDFDLAVLAAFRIGAVRFVREDTSRVSYTLNGVNVWPSIHRLEQAGEIYVDPIQVVCFPGTEAYRAAEIRQVFVKVVKRGIRDGTIKFEKPKKGTKP